MSCTCCQKSVHTRTENFGAFYLEEFKNKPGKMKRKANGAAVVLNPQISVICKHASHMISWGSWTTNEWKGNVLEVFSFPTRNDWEFDFLGGEERWCLYVGINIFVFIDK